MNGKAQRVRRKTVETEQFLLMCARMVRSAGKRVQAADAQDLAALIALQEELDAAIVTAVAGLRSSGTTWEEIGAATGTTRQAAIMKWSRKVAEREAASQGNTL